MASDAALGWADADAIARRLLARFPGRDPLAIRFPDLERWVAELDGFAEGTEAATPRLLEAIQVSWYGGYAASLRRPASGG